MPYSLPYIVHNDNDEFSYDVELAIAFLLSKRDNDSVLNLIKTYYSFKLFETDNGPFILDTHGQSNGEIPLLVCTDINETFKEFVNLEEDEKIKLIKKCKIILEDYYCESMEVKSLVDEIDVINYLITSEKVPLDNTQKLIQPNITDNIFYDNLKKVDNARKNTIKILDTHIKAQKYLESSKNKIEKLHEKQYSSALKESEKTLNKIFKKRVKKIDNIEKEYKIEIQSIEKDFETKIKIKKLEQDKIMDEIEKINYDEKDSIKTLLKKENMLNKIKTSIKVLENKRDKKIGDKKRNKDIKKERLSKEFKNSRLKEIKKQGKIKKTHNKLEEELVDLINKQNNLITLLEKEEVTLSTLINIPYHEGEEILIPFYVFQNENGFGYHPPIKDIGEQSFGFFLKGLLEKSLANKILKHVSQDTLVFNKLIEPLVTMLNDDTYENIIFELNLLNSMDSLNLILVGLFRLHNWGWIDDKDYIQAQKQIIERIKNLMTSPMETLETEIVSSLKAIS